MSTVRHTFGHKNGYWCPPSCKYAYDGGRKNKCPHLPQYCRGDTVPINFFINDFAKHIYCLECDITWHCWMCKDFLSWCDHEIEITGGDPYTSDAEDIDEKCREEEVECSRCGYYWHCSKCHRKSNCPHVARPTRKPY
jgi:hypothetical protein